MTRLPYVYTSWIFCLIFMTTSCENQNSKKQNEDVLTVQMLADMKAQLSASELRNFEKIDKLRDELLASNKSLAAELAKNKEELTSLQGLMKQASSVALQAHAEQKTNDTTNVVDDQNRDLEMEAARKGAQLIPLNNPVLQPK